MGEIWGGTIVATLSLIEQIRRQYPMFSKSERLVADYVCDHLPQISRMSIREFKQAVGVSEPTIFRFCQAIGFRGFKEFKISLAEQTPTFQDYFVAAPSEGKSTVQNLVERLLLTERDAIETTLHMLDYARLDEAAQLVARAQRICLFGVSTSFDICRDMQRRLSRLGISAWASNEFHDAVVQLARFRAEDLLICVSQSGATNEVLDVAKQGQQFGVPLLAITAFPSSPVGRLARVVLPTYAPEITGNRLGMATRIAQFAVADALYMAITCYMGDNVSALMESTIVPLMRR